MFVNVKSKCLFGCIWIHLIKFILLNFSNEREGQCHSFLLAKDFGTSDFSASTNKMFFALINSATSIIIPKLHQKSINLQITKWTRKSTFSGEADAYFIQGKGI